MTRVLVTSAGSAPAIDLLRCLRQDSRLEVTAGDADEVGRAFAAPLCRRTVELPRADREPDAFVERIVALSAEVDFLFPGIDAEIAVLVARGARLACATALAPAAVLAVMFDKAETAARAANVGLSPRTYRIASRGDLDEAFAREPDGVWLRPAKGTSGQGSLPARDADEAEAWMRLWQRRGLAGDWIAQELLTGRNLNWTAVYADGHRVATAAMQRLAYWLGILVPSGVTGQVRHAVTLSEARLDEAGDAAVRALDPRPHGIYSVDLREDGQGRPRLNEVNPRPAGRPWLYAQAGVNLPLAALRAGLGLEVGDAVAAGGLRSGVSIYRQLDVEPIFRMESGGAAAG